MSYDVTLKKDFQIAVFKRILNAPYEYCTILFKLEYTNVICKNDMIFKYDEALECDSVYIYK